VKLSSVYQDSKIGAPSYSDAGKVAQAYVRMVPDRMLWGTDWPHSGITILPDYDALFDILVEWAKDGKTRQRIVTENAENLYGFSKS